MYVKRCVQKKDPEKRGDVKRIKKEELEKFELKPISW